MTPFKSYQPNGTLEAKGFILDGVQVGDWIYYHENGNVYSEGKFDDKGTPIGIWKEYYLNGQIKYEAISKQGNGFSIEHDNLEILNYWTINGEYQIRDGNGVLKFFYENGLLRHTSEWLNNLKNGLFLEFYENGEKFIERVYRDGLKSGESKVFHNNGNLYNRSFYEHGFSIGSYKEWYKNGQICEEGFYQNGKYIIDNFWDDTGKQCLFQGNGYVIQKQGSGSIDIYKQYFKNHNLIKETRL